MARSIQTVSKPTFEQLKMMGADIAHIWSQHGSDFTQYLIHVHRRYPMAELADPMDWHRAVGSTIPLPVSENDPKRKQAERARKLKDLGPAPADPSSLNYWFYAIEQRRLLSGVDVKYASAQEAIAAAHADQGEALEQRDKWLVAQESAKAYALEDLDQQREALAKVEALDARLAKEREAAMERLRSPAPVVEEGADV